MAARSLAGDPDRSLIVARTHAEDPDDVMPPPDSGLALSDSEKSLIRRWIEEGAPFAQHWAFLAPRATTPPRVADTRGLRNDIDRFIGAELEAYGLAMSSEASRETLIRRLSLDLTGLPPTPEEIDAFARDSEPDAYDRLVDRLLASPHFGERMALVWLDVARYADTNGFHHDNVRTAWPVSRLGHPERSTTTCRSTSSWSSNSLAICWRMRPTQQRIASGFCRMHNINDEGGALDPGVPGRGSL